MQTIDELYNEAAKAFDIGNFNLSEKYARECLRINPNDFRALNLLGVLHANKGELEEAALWYEKSLIQNPLNPQALNNLANIVAKEGDLQRAAQLYANAISLEPTFLSARHNYAKILIKLELFDEAIRETTEILKQNPDECAAVVTLGNALRGKGEYKAAEEAYRIGTNFEECKKDALIEFALMKMKQKDNDAALEAFATVLSIDPTHSASYCNIATIFMDKGDFKRASAAIMRAYELDPNDSTINTNLGVLLKYNADFEGARAAFEKSIMLGDKSGAAKTNLGLLYLLFGDYKNGFALYDYRPKKELLSDIPKYAGEELKGKALFVYYDQGLGDTINFARLLRHPKLRDAKITLLVQDELKELFKNSTLGVHILEKDDTLSFDYHTSLIDLLKVLEIEKHTIPKNINYIVDDGQKVEFFKKILPPKKPKIGLVFRGNRLFSGDALRSIDASYFVALKDDRYNYISIQKEFEEEEMALLKSSLGVFDTSQYLKDFSYTSALLSHIDALVSVDTSVAHLAATKNIPTILLVPASPDWRWGLEGHKSEWYESVYIIRKKVDGDWDEVIREAKVKLDSMF